MSDSDAVAESSPPFPSSLREHYRRSAWAIAGYRRLQLGNFVLNFGRFIEQVAQSWLVFHLTGSAAWVGAHAFFSNAPMMLFALPSGAIADRFDRRRVVFGLAAVWAGLAATIALLGWWGMLTAGLVIALTTLEGFCAAGVRPVLSASLQDVVGRDHLTSALAANSVSFNIARLCGPALGGLLIEAVGVRVSFALNAAAFAVVLSAFWGLELGRGGGARGSLGGEIMEAFRFGLSHPGLRRIWWGTAAFCFLAGPIQGILVVFAKQAFGGDASAYGTLLSSMALGALAGAAVAAHAPSRIPRHRLIPGAIACYALAGVAFSQARWFPLGVACMVGVGVFHSTVLISSMTAVQLLAPDGMRGRIISVQMTMFGAMPAGSGLAGLIAARIGAPWTILASMGGLLAVGAYCLAVPIREIDQPRAEA